MNKKYLKFFTKYVNDLKTSKYNNFLIEIKKENNLENKEEIFWTYIIKKIDNNEINSSDRYLLENIKTNCKNYKDILNNIFSII